MFDEDFYVDLVNGEFADSLASKLKLKDVRSGSPRILVRMERYFTRKPLKAGTKFNHYRPSRFFAEKVSTLTIPNATVDRFERAFKSLNNLLTS